MHTTYRRAALIAWAAALLLAPTSLFAAQQYSVSVMDNFYSPKDLTITVGDTVLWRNNGSGSHSVVGDAGGFDSGSIATGVTYGVTFNTAGSYPYHDRQYGSGGSGMSGTVTVLAASAPQTPVYTSSSNSAAIQQLQAQLQQLLAQIQAIQGGTTYTGGSVTTTGGTTVNTYSAACPQIGRSLSAGDSGDDVRRLQVFLAQDQSIYPEALASGYYGSLTQQAVERWQAKFNIVSSGTPASTGFGVVGPRTAAAIAIVCAGGTYNGVSWVGGGTSTQAPVGGYISVTPVSGNAPLVVNVTATVNTTASCTGATYTLDFGDGSAPVTIAVPQGNCGQLQQTYPHTYQYGGSYRVLLSAGSHSTSATVTVSGPAAPGGGTSGNKVPAGTISSFTTAGTAPFTATFYVSCVAGVAYNVVFGDGQDLGGSNVGQTSCDGSLQAITHTYTAAGTYTAELVLFVSQANGTVASQKWGSVSIGVSGGTDSGTSSTYNPPTLSSDDANSLAFTIQFDLPSSCTGYDLAWGDGSAHSTQTQGTCSGGSTAKNLSHTYASAGSYTIVLKRGASLDRRDDITVTISQ